MKHLNRGQVIGFNARRKHVLQNIIYPPSSILPLLLFYFIQSAPDPRVSLSTRERVCSSDPWGRIDWAQVSPPMNNQTQLPPAFLINSYFRQQGFTATIQYEWKVTLHTSDLSVMTMPVWTWSWTIAGIDRGGGRVYEEVRPIIRVRAPAP